MDEHHSDDVKFPIRIGGRYTIEKGILNIGATETARLISDYRFFQVSVDSLVSDDLVELNQYSTRDSSTTVSCKRKLASIAMIYSWRASWPLAIHDSTFP